MPPSMIKIPFVLSAIVQVFEMMSNSLFVSKFGKISQQCLAYKCWAPTEDKIFDS